MNAAALGEFLMLTFGPFIPMVAGAVIALIGTLLVIVMFRKFLPSEDE